MKKLYFITGSQDLYGEETLKQVALDTKKMVEYLNGKLLDTVAVEWKPTVINSESCIAVMQEANVDDDCVGVITWMHTFSPAKMWIKGLQILRKPLCHLHTQANERLPYDTIDMDFMNLNQAAHGDREYGFICARLGIKRQIVVGYYQHENVIAQLKQFAQVAKALDFSRKLKVAMFGNNMRQVAVTDGDRVESQIRYGWEVNYYAIGDLVTLVNAVTEEQVGAKIAEYKAAYTFKTDNMDAVKEQARYEIALDQFVAAHGVGAYTDTFEDLYGLKQLPGLATQRMQGKGIGFGAEGDYKTSALNAVLWKMAEGREGATGFMEDYTYDMVDGYVLGAHMLEVSPSFAATKPAIEVHPLGIGGKADPARLTFGGVKGDGVAVCMTDMGDHFRHAYGHAVTLHA
ncbi:MAG TPA: L-arabinose isomerase, partial [Candidatus Limiplasma sp.]|nr:L-arabinose isomerase [Candidatus Limiplasma sp.]